MEEKNKLLLELENIKKDLQVNSTKTEHTEQLIKQKTKDLAEALNDLAVASAHREKKELPRQHKEKLEDGVGPFAHENRLRRSPHAASGEREAHGRRASPQRQVRCTVCNKRDRDSIITSCYHRFCSKCLTNCLENRDRKCPFCARKFGQHDVKKLYEE